MRAGIVAVPLDLRSAPDFVASVVAKTRPALAIVSRATPAFHQELALPEVDLENLEELYGGLPPSTDVEVAPDDLAEIMFTSGTTGDPKGVMVTHRNLTANLSSASQYVPGRLSDRLISILPLSHMFEQMGGLLMPLRCGANVTYPVSRQPTILFRTLRERGVTLLLLVPQALDLFMKGIEREVSRQGKERTWHISLGAARYLPMRLRRLLFRKVHKQFGGCLDLVFTGGAALDPELGARWNRLGVNIIQGYGATEASPVISCHSSRRPRYDSVGPPIPGVEVRISNQGEVLLRGPNITSGYWEAPEQTALTFDDGWYRTGDLGFIDAEGCLHLQGRLKDMIVLANGQDVYPEDIEAVLIKHPDVIDAVVVGLPAGSDVQVHSAFLVRDAERAPDVVAWANQRLAEHQQVRGFTVWPEDDFPRTHTLKVKKGLVLDAIRSSAADGSEAITAPKVARVGQERGLRHLVSEVADVPLERVAPEMTLGADLNLDSLNRVELLSLIEQELGVYIDESLVSITQAMARAAESRGVEIRTGVEVRRVAVRNGHASGVVLADGDEIEADVVLSNADPKRTFLTLLEPEALGSELLENARRMKNNVSYLKFHCALEELPDFSPYLGAGYDPKHLAYIRVCPSMEYFERSWEDARSGRPSSCPVMYIQIPTVYDPSLTPQGRHVLSAWVMYAPVRLREGAWDDANRQVGEHLIDTITQYAPNFRDAIIDWQLFTPADLERRVGLTDGNIRHLDITSEQMWSRRATPLLSGYRTPIDGLYLCGAGTHPGGEVTGAPGHNAAHAVLRDWGLEN